MTVMGSNLSIKIDDDSRAELEKLANQDNRKLSDYCRLVLKEHIEKRLKNQESEAE